MNTSRLLLFFPVIIVLSIRVIHIHTYIYISLLNYEDVLRDSMCCSRQFGSDIYADTSCVCYLRANLSFRNRILEYCLMREKTRMLFSRFARPPRRLIREHFVSRRSSVGTFSRQQPLTSSGSSSIDSSRGSKNSATAPRLDYRNEISVEEKPDLFGDLDSKYRVSRRLSRKLSTTSLHFFMFLLSE